MCQLINFTNLQSKNIVLQSQSIVWANANRVLHIHCKQSPKFPFKSTLINSFFINEFYLQSYRYYSLNVVL